jgi:hypothetical protein
LPDQCAAPLSFANMCASALCDMKLLFLPWLCRHNVAQIRQEEAILVQADLVTPSLLQPVHP